MIEPRKAKMKKQIYHLDKNDRAACGTKTTAVLCSIATFGTIQKSSQCKKCRWILGKVLKPPKVKQPKDAKAARVQISVARIQRATGEILQSLDKRLVEKGTGTFSSRHEILGVCAEEYKELIDAVQKGSLSDVRDELIDLAVACIFGISCIDSGTLDW